MAKISANFGWSQFTHTLARTIPRDLYRSKRMRHALLGMTKKVRK